MTEDLFEESHAQDERPVGYSKKGEFQPLEEGVAGGEE